MLHKVESEMKRIVDVLIHDQALDGSWDYPFETGIVCDCYMIILLRTLDRNDEELIKGFVERIVSKQEKNGSWKLFHDERDGNVSSTIEAYVALLYSGYRSKQDMEMQRARQFIVSNGGIAKAHFLTKIMLATTGQYEWPRDFFLPIEAILLPYTFPVNFFDLSVYGRANLAPLLILADRQFSMKTKYSLDLTDLMLEREVINKLNIEEQSIWKQITEGIEKLPGLKEELHEKALKHAEQFMIERVEGDGTLYNYFSSTFLMIFALLARSYSQSDSVITNALKGLKSMVTQLDGTKHVQFTTATVWNTALISYALQEAGISSSAPVIQKANQYLLSRQHTKYGDWAIHNPITKPGGWGFSNRNTINPDVDDSTAALRAIRTLAIKETAFRQSWDVGIEWVISMQNKDGGWPAFEKNIDQPLLALLLAELGEEILLDPSAADLTGRTLQFFGSCTRLNIDHQVIKRGVDWLLHNQKPDGSWQGRWGICYIYGTWAAVTGMAAVGIPRTHPAMQKAVKWLQETQNSDGGWGESCKSDSENQYVPLGVSTSTHTAWALDALIAVSANITPEIGRGISFLVDRKHEDWTTYYPKGRGAAGTFYIHYHSYEYIWPLVALAHFKRKFSKD